MLEKLKERRELLAKEHASLLEKYGEGRSALEDMGKRLSMLVGHVSELDFQIKSIQDEENATEEG